MKFISNSSCVIEETYPIFSKKNIRNITYQMINKWNLEKNESEIFTNIKISFRLHILLHFNVSMIIVQRNVNHEVDR